jgi:hypothetical protein
MPSSTFLISLNASSAFRPPGSWASAPAASAPAATMALTAMAASRPLIGLSLSFVT